MLSNREQYGLSDDESESSETSGVTSRVTTLPDTWSESKSNTTLDYQKSLNGLEQPNIPREQNGLSSLATSTTGSVSTVVSPKPNLDRQDSNKTNENKSQVQQTPWVNPYWGPTAKQNTVTSELPTNNTINNATNEP